MADPTWSEIWTMIKARVNLFQKTDLYANNNSPNWLGLEDTFVQALEGEYVLEALSHVRGDRAKLSALLAPTNVNAALQPFLLELARVAGLPERDTPSLLRRLRRYMHDNSYSINSRAITFGTPSAGGGNVGNGTVVRLTVDEEAYNLEGVFLESKRLECIADNNQVDPHQEVWEFRGVEAEQDYLNVLGSGSRIQLVGLHAGGNSTGQILTNPSFEDFTGTAPTAGTPTTLSSTTEVTGWVVTTAANAQILLDTPAPYRGYPGEPDDLYALRFSGNNTITQTPEDQLDPVWDPQVPYILSVRVYRESNCDGNLTLTLGNTTRVVDMTTLTNGAWNTVTLTANKNLYYRNFGKNALTVAINLASRTTGSLVLDDVNCGKMVNLDGTWYAIIGGSTKYLARDVYTFSDALSGSEGILGKWWHRGGLGHLPSNNSAAETITDPS